MIGGKAKYAGPFAAAAFVMLFINCADAGERSTTGEGKAQPVIQKIQIPGMGYEFVHGSFEFPPKGAVATEMLETAIVRWLSANFVLPAVYHHPRILPMSSLQMTRLLYGSFLANGGSGSDAADNPSAIPDQWRAVESLYDAATNTVYLRSEWAGRTPVKVSILVHEMVHHLQNVAHLEYACAQEREKLAYEAQQKWLDMFGLSLSSEFGLSQIQPAPWPRRLRHSLLWDGLVRACPLIFPTSNTIVSLQLLA